jgi:hypothetical protein
MLSSPLLVLCSGGVSKPVLLVGVDAAAGFCWLLLFSTLVMSFYDNCCATGPAKSQHQQSKEQVFTALKTRQFS